jgi:hypothetical protein
MNDTTDPIVLFEELAMRVSRRMPERPSVQEIWQLTAAIERVFVDAPTYIDRFNAHTRALFLACRHAALEGFDGRVQ